MISTRSVEALAIKTESLFILLINRLRFSDFMMLYSCLIMFIIQKLVRLPLKRSCGFDPTYPEATLSPFLE